MCYVEAKCSSCDPNSNIIYGSNSKVTITKSKKTWLAPEYIYTNAKIKQLCKFAEENNEVNLIVMKAPPKHDLISTSCVNSEVLRFNRQMVKKMKPYCNVKLFNTDCDRIFFTSHGQHLNSLGKKCDLK